MQAMQLRSTLGAKAPAAPRAARRATVCAAAPSDEAAPTSRRAVFGLLAAAAAASLAAAPAALANAPAAKNASAASMSSFNMEGTKKMGISAKKRRQLLAKARERPAGVTAQKEGE